MNPGKPMTLIIIAAMTLAAPGCDKSKRLAEQAERHAVRQAEQDVRTAEAHRQVAEGSG